MPNGTKTQARTESADDRRAFCAKKFKWLNALNADKDVQDPAFKVAFAISQYFDVETGETCRLSDKTIAAKTGLPVRCVVRARKVLRDRGWLSWRRTRNGNFYCQEPGATQPAARKAQRRRAPRDTPQAAQTKPSTAPRDTPQEADQDTPQEAETYLSKLDKDIGSKKEGPPPPRSRIFATTTKPPAKSKHNLEPLPGRLRKKQVRHHRRNRQVPRRRQNNQLPRRRQNEKGGGRRGLRNFGPSTRARTT
jgi:hypothetical protein